MSSTTLRSPAGALRLRTSCCRRGPAIVACAASVLLGCQETEQSQLVRALALSDEVAFLCRDYDSGQGVRLRECPDRADDGIRHELLALVTQPLTAEVAVLSFSQGKVLDVDPSTPGPSLLPVGGSPVDVAATPGGVASFVAVAEAGREGIYALPTSCVGAPADGDPRREITLWSACSLPAAPGMIEVIVDPPDVDGTVRAGCEGGEAEEPSAAGRVCAADLRREAAVEPAGRRVLAVTLPEVGQLVLIDAQTLLDRDPGSFEPCPVERHVELTAMLPDVGIDRRLPPELVPSDCGGDAVAHHDSDGASGSVRPAGMTYDDERLYVADRGTPVIHVVDVRDPCSPAEEPPLLPVALDWPDETVTTRDVAVSPVTSKGEKFLYAIDERDGSVMAFELSAGGARTPLIRPGAQRLPFDPADRISFGSPARDVEIIGRDMPLLDPDTGVTTVGQQCDPDPDAAAPGSLYRTRTDYVRGARPSKLRGVFGMVALANGQIAVVDIEDYDAPCRRPVGANPSQTENHQGCAQDPEIEGFVTTDGTRTVTDEVTCNVVQPHTARSRHFLLTNSRIGVHAPTLRTFPKLTTPDGVLATGRDEDGQQHPLMLAAAPTEGQSEEAVRVYVGTTLHGIDEDADRDLVIDPEKADHCSLTLPLVEPRSFASAETFGATYEGRIASERDTGRVLVGQHEFVDDDAGFCSRGVQDMNLAAEWGAELGVTANERRGFAEAHADFVQLSADFDDEEPYWESSAGRACGDGGGLAACEELFGTAEDPLPARDLLIVEAYQDRLVVEPRGLRESAHAERWALIRCCFPTLTSYMLRGGRQWIVSGSVSGFRHRVRVGPDGRCVADCSGRRSLYRGRALEISSSAKCPEEEGAPCGIGRAGDDDLVCVVDRTAEPVIPGSGEVADGCIFENLNARFVIYRGQSPSERDMRFVWDVNGGFVPLSISTATVSTGSSVLPQTLSYLERSDTLVAVDAIAGGVMLFDLNTLKTVGQPFL